MELRVQLKVCEACGCLWYRPTLEVRAYCTTCNERLKEFPTPQSRKRRGRPRKVSLPTVWAVQATSEHDSFNEEGIALNGRTFSRHTRSQATYFEKAAWPSDPDGVPQLPVLVAQSATFTNHAGGAQ
ncbi:hypothetical protein [Acidicapsa ligni]|uniref:hypothetical protein n=1 Tax=Acidicapsa ligni TaxID=542300 RepID=UPI0021DF97D9|nr:hypothetical protein [Acidicapsa ligni]